MLDIDIAIGPCFLRFAILQLSFIYSVVSPRSKTCPVHSNMTPETQYTKRLRRGVDHGCFTCFSFIDDRCLCYLLPSLGQIQIVTDLPVVNHSLFICDAATSGASSSSRKASKYSCDMLMAVSSETWLSAQSPPAATSAFLKSKQGYLCLYVFFQNKVKEKVRARPKLTILKGSLVFLIVCL